jgi:hypothetical protein
MARFNEILAGRFNRALQKLTGIKGMASTPQLGTEVIPSVNFPLGVEFRYLESWFRYRAFVTSGPVAAVNSGIRMRNPAGSNVVAVVEKVSTITTNTQTNSQVNMNRGQIGVDLDTTAGLTGGSQREDPRGQPASSVILSINSVALVTLNNPTAIDLVFQTAGQSIPWINDENQEYLLMPGDSFQWHQALAQNQAVNLALCWRERFLEESERT